MLPANSCRSRFLPRLACLANELSQLGARGFAVSKLRSIPAARDDEYAVGGHVPAARGKEPCPDIRRQ
jgi:hypothetical protein